MATFLTAPLGKYSAVIFGENFVDRTFDALCEIIVRNADDLKDKGARKAMGIFE